ncbi:Erythrocyte band 7 integral membrane protein [Fasciolopsis buskii]|uniref:Erythrocyte band 7 integral membrane protein n=1 Tax=Fasciolopsis buskii TaxID=27845 RepID=A0A8E0VGZ1_9TREM|nr:Erythrocyte band 7 integral membrane protein [Fasciolopsis buski]
MQPTDDVCSVNGTYNSSNVPTHHTQTTYVIPAPGQNFDEQSELNFGCNDSTATVSRPCDGRNVGLTAVDHSALNRVHRYENSGNPNTCTANSTNSTTIPVSTPINNNFLSESTALPRTETASLRSSPERKPALSKPRVSFDEDSNTTEYTVNVPHHYEDVVTLRVPSKENLWFSCRGSEHNRKRSRVRRWFHKPYQTTSSTESTRWSWLRGRPTTIKLPGDEMESKSNGNHLKSIYENESEEHQRMKVEKQIVDESNDTDRDRGPSSPKSDFYRTCTGHNWEADQNPKSSGDPDGSNNSNNNSMVWTTNFLAALSILLIILTFPFSLIYCIRIVAEYERAVVLRMGNLIPKGKGTKGPGLFFILPCIDSVRKVDLRTVTFAIPPQELLTRDSVTVSVDAVVYYRVLNPVASVLNIEDAARSTRLLAQTTIRNVLGTKDLAQILMDRDEISTSMQSSLDATTDAWGVKVRKYVIVFLRATVENLIFPQCIAVVQGV